MSIDFILSWVYHHWYESRHGLVSNLILLVGCVVSFSVALSSKSPKKNNLEICLLERQNDRTEKVCQSFNHLILSTT